MKNNRIGEIIFNEKEYYIDKFHYYSGRLGLMFTEKENNTAWFSGTLDIHNVAKNEGEVIIKSHHENSGLLETLLDNDFIRKQTIPITLGYNKVYICKLKQYE